MAVNGGNNIINIKAVTYHESVQIDQVCLVDDHQCGETTKR